MLPGTEDAFAPVEAAISEFFSQLLEALGRNLTR
jgi:hypothetical protein